MSKQLRQKGYMVTAEKTGAEYPNHAHKIGLGWAFVLRKEGKKIGDFSDHTMAWVWAGRLDRMISAAP